MVTSSVAAIYGYEPVPEEMNETHWANPDTATPYSKSKTLAERAIWDFQKDLPESERFEVAVINPALVWGPALTSAKFEVGDIYGALLTGKMETAIPRAFGFVDVRDVADAHLAAVKVPEAAGNRHILYNEMRHFSYICKVMEETFASEGFNPTSKFVDESQIKHVPCNNTRSKEVLGINYRPIEQMVKDMGRTLIDIGYFNR